ncbi:hypothetical protein TcCL_NonESM04531 [Trypanosoma cruzi]|nr:hypothetical protein TcCL_NonESM04531 [Trypanosoma cruzi]
MDVLHDGGWRAGYWIHLKIHEERRKSGVDAIAGEFNARHGNWCTGVAAPQGHTAHILSVQGEYILDWCASRGFLPSNLGLPPTAFNTDGTAIVLVLFAPQCRLT